jgi:hypothetical protein
VELDGWTDDSDARSMISRVGWEGAAVPQYKAQNKLNLIYVHVIERPVDIFSPSFNVFLMSLMVLMGRFSNPTLLDSPPDLSLVISLGILTPSAPSEKFRELWRGVDLGYCDRVRHHAGASRGDGGNPG